MRVFQLATCVRGLIFLRVPEGAVIARVDSHRGVVTPAVVSRLRSASRHEKRFVLQGAERVADFPAGVSNRRVRAAARDAVADADVARADPWRCSPSSGCRRQVRTFPADRSWERRWDFELHTNGRLSRRCRLRPYGWRRSTRGRRNCDRPDGTSDGRPARRGSASLPGCGMQSCVSGHGATNGAVPGMEIGPARVEFFGFAKSTWNFQRFKALDPGSIFIRKFGEPAGGRSLHRDLKAAGWRRHS